VNSDAHPGDLENVIFPGQDYNNARVFDFQNVTKWEDNKLDRTKDARMGWSDLSICLEGPVIEDLGAHFVQRWNFIYDSKYGVVGNSRYKPLSLGASSDTEPTYRHDGSNKHFGTASQKLTGLHAHAEVDEDIPVPTGAFPSGGNEHHQHRFEGTPDGYFHQLKSRFRRGLETFDFDRESKPPGTMGIQLLRSAGRWSHGLSTEVSCFARRNKPTVEKCQIIETITDIL
jgi:phospholipase D1/2